MGQKNRQPKGQNNMLGQFFSMMHGDDTCWNEKHEESEERINGRKVIREKKTKNLKLVIKKVT